MPYCMYLRKSRADIEAEAHGEGETLARHEKLLLEVARRDQYDVTQIYREIVSGETIAARPVIQHVLQEVEDGLWDGVLVVEVERLAVVIPSTRRCRADVQILRYQNRYPAQGLRPKQRVRRGIF